VAAAVSELGKIDAARGLPIEGQWHRSPAILSPQYQGVMKF